MIMTIKRHLVLCAALLLMPGGCTDRDVDSAAGDGVAGDAVGETFDPGDQGGPGTAGFGQPCDKDTACLAGLLCVATAGQTGFCSAACTQPGAICKGAPTGTLAACLLKTKLGQYYCAFLCKTATTSWPCPGGMSCSSGPTPAGSKQFICAP